MISRRQGKFPKAEIKDRSAVDALAFVYIRFRTLISVHVSVSAHLPTKSRVFYIRPSFFLVDAFFSGRARGFGILQNRACLKDTEVAKFPNLK